MTNNTTPKQPWGKGTPWSSQTAFMTYLRGCLRKAWSTNPIKLTVLKNNRKQIANPNPRGNKPTVWGCTCSICNQDYAMKDIQVDHITPAGSLREISDIQGFVERLLCITEEDLRIVCKTCNSILAYADKQGISFERALLEKEIIKICKDKKDKEFFIERGLDVPKNLVERKNNIRQILIKELDI